MKGLRWIFGLCGGLEVLRFGFLLIWFNLSFQSGLGSLTQGIFLFLAGTSFLYWIQFFVLMGNPQVPQAWPLSLLLGKGALVIPDLWFLVLGPGSGDILNLADGSLWIWLATFMDLAVLWLLVNVVFLQKSDPGEAS